MKPTVERASATAIRTILILWALCLALPVRCDAGDLVISELMYDAVGGSGYEFVELHNSGSNSVDLLGAYFQDGISYTFSNSLVLAPDEYLVIAGDSAAFASRYPSVTNLAPLQYQGRLRDEGERIRLYSSTGSVIFSVTYNNRAPWPEAAAGLGSSLMLASEDGDPDDADSWGASAEAHGNPGRSGSLFMQDIVINEVLAHSDPPQEDAIELHNVTTSSVDISGWYLSDEELVRKKYRIPDATTIPAGGYAAFYEYDFNNTSDAGIIPFAIHSKGDDIYLSEADGSSNVVRFVDQVVFDVSDNGVSFGRYPDGSGPFTTLASLTLGTDNPGTLLEFRTGQGESNALPMVGPVVITEIMYHPTQIVAGVDNAADEYIELLNITTNTVPLYDPANPTNTWKLTAAVDYVFPTNEVIQPGQLVLVVGTTNIPAFRSTYGLASNVVIYGPWIGKLDNSDESLRLRMADSPESNNVVPYLVVEQIDYRDNPPWPVAADGQGVSLERVDPATYGNVARNWQVGPLGGSPGQTNELALPVGSVIISEFMAQNRGTLLDEDRESSDWIEIYNATSNAVSINGWHLTDNTDDLAQWTFPDIMLDGYSFLLVFASGKNRAVADSELHASFNLNASGEYLALVRDDLVIEHEISPLFEQQFTDVSYGVAGAGGGPVPSVVLEYMADPTPGTSNSGTMPGVAVSPVFSPPGGVYATNFILTLSAPGAEPGSTIRYTLDGSDPVPSSSLYSAPIWITGDTEVSARLYSSGLVPGPIERQTYRTTFLGINEILASNVRTFPEMKDYSDYADWVEIYNDSGQAVDLGGYFLSDDLESPFKWAIPAGATVAAGGYLLIWLDEVDFKPGWIMLRKTWPYAVFTSANYHSNFKLSGDGEAIGLFSSSGAVVDSQVFPAQQGDVSYGRYPDGAASWGYFGEPTPATTNMAPLLPANDEFTDQVEFSTEGGFFTSNLNVALSTPTPGAVIRYTLDGARPLGSSPVYTVPLLITNTRPIRARAFVGDMHPGVETTHMYFINEPASTLPVISLVGDPETLYGADLGIIANTYKGKEIPMSLDYYESQTNRVFRADVGMRIYGFNIHRFAQKPFSIYLRGKYGESEINYQLFDEKPIGVFDRWVLRNGGDDWAKTLIRDAAGQEMGRGRIVNGVQCWQPVVTYVNGEYYGLLQMREKLDEGYLEDNYGADIENVEFIETYATPTGTIFVVTLGDTEYYEQLEDFAAANDLSIPANYEHVAAVVDTDDLIDFVIHQSYAANTSWYHNRRWWRSLAEGGKFRWLVFDLDRGFDMDWINHNTMLDIKSLFPLFEGLLDNPDFRDRLIQRYAAHISTTYDSDRIIATIDRMAAEIAPEVVRHSDKWGSSGGFANEGVWLAHLEEMREFARRRCNVLRDFGAITFGLNPARINAEVTAQGQGSVLINDIPVSDGSTNILFCGAPAVMEAVPAVGYRFVRWDMSRMVFEQSFIPVGSTWKYDDSGNDLGTGWRAPAYDDSGWASGPAQLGYGDGDEATTISYGGSSSEKHITYYFRTNFALPDVAAHDGYIASFLRDDAGVVYLNGKEAFRQEMRGGTISYDTRALYGASVFENSYIPERIDESLLVSGINSVAVEVHQISPTSGDMGFDLAIWAAEWIAAGSLTNPIITYRPVASNPAVSFTAIFEPTGESILPNVITSNLTLSAGASPYFASGDIIIPTNTTLEIPAGVEIRMPAGASIYDYGQLLVYGTELDPVWIVVNSNANAAVPPYRTAPINDRLSWGGLAIDQATHAAVLSNLWIRGATMASDPVRQKAAISSYYSTLDAYGLDMEDVQVPIFAQYGDSISLRQSRIKADVVGDHINVKYAGFALVEDCTFIGGTAVDADAIDYDGLTGIIRRNEIGSFAGSNSDGIDIGENATNVLVTGNLIHDCSDKGISVGQASTVIVESNIIVNCAQGVGIKDTGSYADIRHTTFHNNDYGVAVFEKNLGAGGGSADITGSIFSDSDDEAVYVDALSTAAIRYSLSDKGTLPGINNVSATPQFRNVDQTNFNLQAGSPAVDTGDPAGSLDPDGTLPDMGPLPVDFRLGQLAVTEIHYNPPVGSNAFEYIELYNLGGAALDLTGFSFTRGVAHTFGAASIATGEHIVVVYDATNFTNIGSQVFQWSGGSLANEGEKIELRDAESNILDAVSYNDQYPWPEEPDGSGPSLSLLRPEMDNALPQNWTYSFDPSGTPGAIPAAGRDMTNVLNYIFLGHTRSDEMHSNEQSVQRLVERIDYSEFDLLMLGGDYTWSSTVNTQTLEYLDALFDLGSPATMGALGNHDYARAEDFSVFTGRDLYYSYKTNNIMVVVLDTAIDAADIVGDQFLMLSNAVDAATDVTHLIVVHHHIIWMVDYPPLASVLPTVGASTKELSDLNFYTEVYPLLLRAQSNGVQVICVAGDRTNIEIEHTTPEGIHYMAAGLAPHAAPENRFVVTFQHSRRERRLTPQFTDLPNLPYLPDEPLVITEIHYNPQPSDGPNAAYVELYNRSASPIDLSESRFLGGITNSFAGGTTIGPGESIVICEDATWYQASGRQVFEWDTAPISGEPIRIKDAVGLEIDYVPYQTGYPWPMTANGGGPTLHLRDAYLDNALGKSWEASATDGGSAGTNDLLYPHIAGLTVTGQVLYVEMSDAATGLVYQLEFSPRLISPDWQPLSTAVTAMQSQAVVSTSNGYNRGFVRIRRDMP